MSQFKSLLDKIDVAKFQVDNLWQQNGFWMCTMSPRFQQTGRAVSPEWARGSSIEEALERAYNEAVKTFGTVPVSSKLGIAVKEKPYVDPLS